MKLIVVMFVSMLVSACGGGGEDTVDDVPQTTASDNVVVTPIPQIRPVPVNNGGLNG